MKIILAPVFNSYIVLEMADLNYVKPGHYDGSHILYISYYLPRNIVSQLHRISSSASVTSAIPVT